MKLFNAYVQTSHRNTRVYEVAAMSEEAATREAMEYGHVQYTAQKVADEAQCAEYDLIQFFNEQE